jgi:hypothetical protein
VIKKIKCVEKGKYKRSKEDLKLGNCVKIVI